MFFVNSEPAVNEVDNSHSTPDKPQAVTVPVVLNGRIGRPGELDYYSFDALADQELVFEVFSKPASVADIYYNKPVFDGNLTLYEAGDNWFGPNRARFLAFNDEPISNRVSADPQLDYRFRKAGRYLISVGSLLGRGSPDYTYQLRIHSADQGPAERRVPAGLIDPRLQAFARKLQLDRPKVLLSRTVLRPDVQAVSAGASSTAGANEGAAAPKSPKDDLRVIGALATPIVEREPNETASQALEVPIPVLIEGTIERPGDVDVFKFKVESGQRLAFEIETPNATPPDFSPRLAVLDTEGHELLNNIYKRKARERYLKDLRAKVLYTFSRTGEYYLQIRDVTSLYGNSSFTYRILIRSHVPHVGTIEVHETRPHETSGQIWKFALVDRINLEAGRVRKLFVVSDLEEGFDGNIAISIEGCPLGVQMFPSTEVDPEPRTPLDEGQKERFLPRTGTATLILSASSDAPLTAMPQFIRIVCRPVVDGIPGSLLVVKEIPLMVVSRAQEGLGSTGLKQERR